MDEQGKALEQSFLTAFREYHQGLTTFHRLLGSKAKRAALTQEQKEKAHREIERLAQRERDTRRIFVAYLNRDTPFVPPGVAAVKQIDALAIREKCIAFNQLIVKMLEQHEAAVTSFILGHIATSSVHFQKLRETEAVIERTKIRDEIIELYREALSGD